MTEFQEYPKMMVHPNAVKGGTTIIEGTAQYDARGNLIRADYQGTPDKFPPVLVHSLDQEEEHASRGYISQGKSDPEAFARAVATPMPPNYQPVEWPKWIDGVLYENEDDAREKGALKVNGGTRVEPAPEVADRMAKARAARAAKRAQVM